MFPVTTSEAGTVIEVDDQLDIVSVPELETLIKRLGEERPDPIIVSLTKCTYCDSSALSAFVKAHQALKDRFAVVVAPENTLLRRVFEIVGMDQILAVYPSIDAAVDPTSKRATP
jgi:anti-anti-sigma factor